MYNFDPYNVLLAIATNIPVLLMTAFVLESIITLPPVKKCSGLNQERNLHRCQNSPKQL